MDLNDIKISQLIEIMESKEISSEEITKTCISNIEKEGLDSLTFQTLLKDEAIDKAREIDKKRSDKKSLASLSGIPFAVTDDISTRGVLTTAGSKMLENYIPPFNASAIDRLLEEEGILVGKIKVSEFGLKPTDNISKTLDAKGAVFALSTAMDPNKVSMRASYGLVSRYGVIGASSSFDQLVPITNSVEDMASILNVIVAYDKKDSTSISRDRLDYNKSLKTSIKGMKIGIARDLFTEDIDIDKLVEELESLGALVEEVSLPSLAYVLPVYEILSSGEFASNSARYDGISMGYRTKEYTNRGELYKKTRAEGFSKEAKKKILFGNYVISSDQYETKYKKAQKIRAMIKKELSDLTDKYGLLMLPFRSSSHDGLNLLASVTGLPSLTMGHGIQFIGGTFKEEDLLSLGYAYENIVDKKASKEVETND